MTVNRLCRGQLAIALNKLRVLARQKHLTEKPQSQIGLSPGGVGSRRGGTSPRSFPTTPDLSSMLCTDCNLSPYTAASGECKGCSRCSSSPDKKQKSIAPAEFSTPMKFELSRPSPEPNPEAGANSHYSEVECDAATSVMESFRMLLWFWREYYLRRGRDRCVYNCVQLIY